MRDSLHPARGDTMDKQKLIGGVVLLGIGLWLLALGFYMIILTAGNPFYMPGKSHRIIIPVLIGLSFIFGSISTVTGVIKINKSRKP